MSTGADNLPDCRLHRDSRKFLQLHEGTPYPNMGMAGPADPPAYEQEFTQINGLYALVRVQRPISSLA